MANNSTQSHWIVKVYYNNNETCYGRHLFYVQGNGIIHSTGLYDIAIADTCFKNSNPTRITGDKALSTILGLTGYFYDEDPMVVFDRKRGRCV